MVRTRKQDCNKCQPPAALTYIPKLCAAKNKLHLCDIELYFYCFISRSTEHGLTGIAQHVLPVTKLYVRC